MPFKTRLQKISAENRRFAIIDAGLAVYKGEQKEDIEERQRAQKTIVTSLNNYAYVGSDLVKIALLALSILASQFLLKFLFASSLSFSFVS